jgi:hypothetical protein
MALYGTSVARLSTTYRDSVTRFFASSFINGSSSPKPLIFLVPRFRKNFGKILNGAKELPEAQEKMIHEKTLSQNLMKLSV